MSDVVFHSSKPEASNFITCASDHTTAGSTVEADSHDAARLESLQKRTPTSHRILQVVQDPSACDQFNAFSSWGRPA